ncbi:MAG: tripartite tricarboxylate transporter substrate-binding protein, partial [Reyranella sp.]|nr:tripartite tricarboxylate transporter substrate-binding protein [Reyranella sp.]
MKMLKGALAGALMLLSVDAMAQAWPSKPIKLIAPYPPGGQTDVVARYFAEKLTGVLGQQVIVENKAGAQGMVGAEIAKNAAPDGYTFVYVNSSMMCINPYVYKKMPYDGFKDFVPVTQHGLAPLMMVVPPTLGPKSVK